MSFPRATSTAVSQEPVVCPVLSWGLVFFISLPGDLREQTGSRVRGLNWTGLGSPRQQGRDSCSEAFVVYMTLSL